MHNENATSLKITRVRYAIRRKTGCKAFSLVEVVVAIGIVAFAVLAIVGMLPVGLTNANRAASMQATGNIVSQIRGQVALLSFVATNNASGNTIQDLATSNFYYTLDGIPTNQASAYYTASFALYPLTNQVLGTAFNTNNAQSLVVKLVYPPVATNQSYTFSMIVARQTDN